MGWLVAEPAAHYERGFGEGFVTVGAAVGGRAGDWGAEHKKPPAVVFAGGW